METKPTYIAKLEGSIDDLARITKQGFDGVKKEFDGVRKKFDGVNQKIDGVNLKLDSFKQETHDNFNHVNARLDLLERDVSEIRKHAVYREEFDRVLTRLERVEKVLHLRPKT